MIVAPIGHSITKEKLKRIDGLCHFADKRNLAAIRAEPARDVRPDACDRRADEGNTRIVGRDE
jgi:hypothetical protein